MMELHGKQLIGNGTSGIDAETFRAIDPRSGGPLAPDFHEATEAEVDQAMELARQAFDAYRRTAPATRATFLRRIADGIEALGDDLIERAAAETALGRGRLEGERARTTGQLRLFAEVIEEGSWVEARIDHARPDRQPLPRPDLRRMLIPLGPVAVFGASNFPFAFSVPGGDTASALAAGCPVVVKGHPAHPGTSEMAGRAIVEAAADSGMPEGVFSLVHGRGHAVGLALARHPHTKAIAFTGSLRGGRALFDAAATRPEPIPVHAEMGSSNPVFVLPGALEERPDALAAGLVQSVTLGGGQFCTNPGLVLGIDGEPLERFIAAAASLIAEQEPASMLYAGICEGYRAGVSRAESVPGVQVAARSQREPDSARTEAEAVILTADDQTYLANAELAEEIFGPATLVVRGRSKEALLRAAGSLHGHLTATIHGTVDDLAENRELVEVLQTKVGRLIFNGFPTGVEVAPAMQHGGPYPATTDSRTTSVGTAAIYRFARPVCFQDFPQAALPEELRDGNPRGIMRLVENGWTRE